MIPRKMQVCVNDEPFTMADRIGLDLPQTRRDVMPHAHYLSGANSKRKMDVRGRNERLSKLHPALSVLRHQGAPL